MIHGGGARGDWTEGCIAVDNEDMDKLYAWLHRGDPVYINP